MNGTQVTWATGETDQADGPHKFRDPAWVVKGTGNFNPDLRSGILLQHTSGQVAVLPAGKSDALTPATTPEHRG
jgi:hypothetical protein